MRAPVVGVFDLYSRTLRDLDEAFALARVAWRRLNLRAKILGIRRYVATVEPAVAKNGRCWHLHFHAVLEMRAVDERRLARWWRQTTDGRGRFELDRRQVVMDVRALARYTTKTADWSPSPGELRLGLLSTLIEALRHERLVRTHGFRARRRQPVWIIGRKSSGTARPHARRPTRRRT